MYNVYVDREQTDVVFFWFTSFKIITLKVEKLEKNQHKFNTKIKTN